MNRRTKAIFSLLGITVGALALGGVTACSSDHYNQFREEGYNVRVYYDSNKGTFGDEGRVINVVDVLNRENYDVDAEGNVNIPLIDPCSPLRGEGQMNIRRASYTFVGWYQSRELRYSTNEKGDKVPVDIYGCERIEQDVFDKDGKKTGVKYVNEYGMDWVQDYVYSDPWDFNTDKLSVSATKSYKKDEYALKLYAAWIPNMSFAYYAEGDNGWEMIGLTDFEYSRSSEVNANGYKENEIVAPTYVGGEGAMNHKLGSTTFPSVEGKTFTGLYASESKTESLEKIAHSGSYDVATAVAKDPVVKVYTTWKDGVYYKIETAQQMNKNGSSSGIYEILNDIEFTDTVKWPASIVNDTFTGKILGGGHKISGISVSQTNGSQYSGIFGNISSSAVIENVTFENATLTINLPKQSGEAGYGLFAGYVNSSAQITGVSVSGSIVLKSTRNYAANVTNKWCIYGLVVGLGDSKGISFENVKLKIAGTEITGKDDPNKGKYNYYFSVAETETGSGIYINGDGSFKLASEKSAIVRDDAVIVIN